MHPSHSLTFQSFDSSDLAKLRSSMNALHGNHPIIGQTLTVDIRCDLIDALMQRLVL